MLSNSSNPDNYVSVCLVSMLSCLQTYCKPTITTDPVFKVKGAVHPVVSSIQQSTFVSNDCDMDEHRLWIVTGPNMGGMMYKYTLIVLLHACVYYSCINSVFITGKSTFLRQNALIAVLAQVRLISQCVLCRTETHHATVLYSYKKSIPSNC